MNKMDVESHTYVYAFTEKELDILLRESEWFRKEHGIELHELL